MAGMAHGHARPFQGHLVWPWKGQRAPEIDAKRCLSAPHEQKQKLTDSARAEPQAPDSADRGGLLALAEARARLAKHSPPNQKFVNFGYARYTRAWRLRRFFCFFKLWLRFAAFWLFKFSPLQPQKRSPTPKCALWITHFFSKNGGESV